VSALDTQRSPLPLLSDAPTSAAYFQLSPAAVCDTPAVPLVNSNRKLSFYSAGISKTNQDRTMITLILKPNLFYFLYFDFHSLFLLSVLCTSITLCAIKEATLLPEG